MDKQFILAATALMSSVITVVNLATLHRTAPTRFLPQEHHTTKTDLIQDIDIPTSEGTDHTPLIMVPDMGDISSGHSPAAIPTATEAAVSEGTPHSPHPATAAACAALWPVEASINTHTMTPTTTVTHHPTLTISPTDTTHAIQQTRAGLTQVAPTALHRKHSKEKPSYI